MTATDYQPTVKSVQPINFLFFRTETSLHELSKFFDVAPALFAEALKHNLQVTGPIHWHYFGFTDVSKPFTLEIALPVSETIPGYDGPFHFKRTEVFKCVSVMHDGNWLELGQSYQKLTGHAAALKLMPTGNNREVYVNVDFVNPEANVTEVQLGVC